MDCTEVIEKLSDFLDEDARNELCREIEEHLSHCHNCRVEVDTVRKTIVLYQADRQISAPISVASKLQATLARAYASLPAPSPD